jgi:hypothetical protein
MLNLYIFFANLKLNRLLNLEFKEAILTFIKVLVDQHFVF